MCGIAGIVRLKGQISPKETQSLENALLSQAHRGPDASSTWSDEKVALGHNRLSIIDLSSSANQPFHREDLGLTIVFNGEIYNYQKLKIELQAANYQFHTTSDTEVILASYRQFGQKLCEHLVGMFAFFIYDHISGEVFAARDRFGEKPIFYIQTADCFYFASELNALRKLFPNQLTINPNAVVDLMENMYINLHHSIYKEVEIFKPANQLLIKGESLSWTQFYEFPKQVSNRPGFDSLKREVREKLNQIILDQLHADVPVATFLSSGIDSSVITAISKELKPDILAITMSTGDPESDEAEAAVHFAKKLDIRQEIVRVDPGSLTVLTKLLKNIQPLADASLIPTHLVTQAVSSHTKVMLSGDAGDEVFGSYNKPNLFRSFGQKTIPGGASLVSGIMKFSDSSWEKYLSDKNRIRIGGWQGFYQKTNLSGCFYRVFKAGRPQKYVKSVANGLLPAYEGNLEKLSFGVDVLTRLPADFLLKVDASSMLSSLEVRAPFLDHRLVDLSFSSDLNSLMPNGRDKEITRAIYRDFAGYEHQGSKKGFSIPYMNYLRADWGVILEGFLNEGLSAQYLSFNTDGLLEMLQELRQSARHSLARILFSALVMEIWLRVFHLEKEIEFSFSKN